jgi:hypothetical protein
VQLSRLEATVNHVPWETLPVQVSLPMDCSPIANSVQYYLAKKTQIKQIKWFCLNRLYLRKMCDRLKRSQMGSICGIANLWIAKEILCASPVAPSRSVLGKITANSSPP